MVITISKKAQKSGIDGVIGTDISINYLVDFIAQLIMEMVPCILIDDKGNVFTHLNDDINPIKMAASRR